MEKKQRRAMRGCLKPGRGGSTKPGALVPIVDGALERVTSAPPEEWWNRWTLPEMRERVSLPQALNDIAMLSLAHLARRLASQKTEQSVKDQIALTMGPKLAIEVRQRAHVESSPDTESVLRTYKIR